MLYRIIGTDPGGTTGVVAFTVSYGTIINVESFELDLVGVGNYFEQVKLDPTVTVCYEVANKFQASGHMSSEVIGIIKWFALKSGSGLVSVTQSAHKRLINRDVLKRAGLYVPGQHAKDAASVGLFQVVGNLKVCRHVLRPEEAT